MYDCDTLCDLPLDLGSQSTCSKVPKARSKCFSCQHSCCFVLAFQPLEFGVLYNATKAAKGRIPAQWVLVSCAMLAVDVPSESVLSAASFSGALSGTTGRGHCRFGNVVVGSVVVLLVPHVLEASAEGKLSIA